MWLNKLERKYGKYAISNLSLYLIVGYIIGYVATMISPELYGLMAFNPYLIMRGQIWRIVTWMLLIPEGYNVLFAAIMLYFYYQLGTSLERTWGTFRYNLYIFSGILFTIIGAIITYFFVILYLKGEFGAAGADLGLADVASTSGQVVGQVVSTYYVTTSILLAFAATYPEMEILLYFVLPLKIKWLGFLYGAEIIYDFISSPWPRKIMIVFSLLNFLVFFLTTRNYSKVSPSNIKRKREFKRKIREANNAYTYENGARHKCAICGRTELDDPNLTFRYCSKCSGGKEYCQDHLFTHAHN